MFTGINKPFLINSYVIHEIGFVSGKSNYFLNNFCSMTPAREYNEIATLYYCVDDLSSRMRKYDFYFKMFSKVKKIIKKVYFLTRNTIVKKVRNTQEVLYKINNSMFPAN